MFKIVIIIAVLLLLFAVYKMFAGNSQAAQQNIQLGKDFLAANAQAEGVQTTDSGLQYLLLQAGTGTTRPSASDRVEVHYHGSMINGVVFDSSVERGQSITFGLNQVIKGWTEGLQTMVVGEKKRLFIPSELAYGNRGAGKIPPGSTLIFDVELIAINP
ncbi:FKBP-type peptidyl-prolyl cis-trans isomerase [Dasania sp. GY-MA-18]|uniref:Peptidyl-prolyl cis-trans isomerase n=1 Tax=Dasania phycosphaerae TaxID=2950436 RepID=A0A9J6RLC7_9GAMM|nr:MULTISPECIES: FKBP-type peptidyl-prolyl cis-trans isomerase [Dasania]MCR8922579.1 FKBP-type peptidyl-prolyl cis-trans isomerase [Dasania sp. GY-MA-18]MCZ0865008.1 FKBP-type peptidyl-prolyl cis-trans isomerase [Dasania phycosphaerae]MCZ0868735.1 FKBP-type peptidyl-prolyl cis-trans isomerase [Dasania phycosphaerae]